MSIITPFLWFNDKAEEAATFYAFCLHELESAGRHPLRRRRTGTEGIRDDGQLRARRSAIHRAEWWSSVPVHRSGVVRRQLRGSAGGGLLLGEADVGRRQAVAVRIAEADRRTEITARDAGAAADAENRHFRPGTRCQMT